MFKTLQKRFGSNESFVSLSLGLVIVLLLGTFVVNAIKKQVQQNSPESKAAETQVELPTTHKVESGETLWSIAEKYYQSGYNWVDLQKENKLAEADRIEEGQELTIPKVTPIVPQGEQISAATSEVKPEAKTYVVKHGDNLWTIAVANYNNGYKWVDIAKANKLANPDVIHAGNELILP